MYTSSVAGTFIAAVREFVDADVIIYQVSLCCIVLGFPCFCHVFYDPPLYRGPGTAPFDAPRSPLAEFGVGARSYARDPEGCCVGRAWHSCAAAGGRATLLRAVPKRGILRPKARRHSYVSVLQYHVYLYNCLLYTSDAADE